MSTAELFEDDLMRLIMRRLSVRIQPTWRNSSIEVLLVDNATGYAVRCTGPALQLDPAQLTVSLEGGITPTHYSEQQR